MEVVTPGARRARFEAQHLGPIGGHARAHASALCAALDELEDLRLSPLLEDGAVAGNGALRLPGGTWLASASARRSREPAVVEIVRFDPERFVVGYRSDDPAREPTSDVALHWCALFAPHEGARPIATLHGHALETDADALRLALPISDAEHVFGTLGELRATQALLARFPFPAHRAWIRRGHGFLVAEASLDAARASVRALAAHRL